MVCGGFACSKNALAALNILYILVAFILITVAAYCRVVAIVTSLALVGGIIGCGVFLLFIALIGLIGAIKHHQVLLFFYMIILFLLFLLQFSLACACLAIDDSQKDNLAKEGWRLADDQIKTQVQNTFNCCGLSDQLLSDQLLNKTDPKKGRGHPSCSKVSCCIGHEDDACCKAPVNGSYVGSPDPCHCTRCFTKLRDDIHTAFAVTGGVGLFFSFTEILGVWITVRFRNQKDPRANPSSFL